LHVVCKTASAVDLDHRDPLSVLRFERLVAADVDRPQVERELVLQRVQLRQRAIAQVAALGVVDDDADARRPTGRCRG
jgi:hypothetical protein